MKINDILKALEGKLLVPGADQEKEYVRAFSSDLMSDVLTLSQDHLMLVTGLANVQTIRTAEMADISCIVFVRNKKVSTDMTSIAREAGIALIECRYSMFRASGLLYQAGIKPVY